MPTRRELELDRAEILKELQESQERMEKYLEQIFKELQIKKVKKGSKK